MRALFFLALSACVSPLPEPFVVTDLRIVALVAEPPEAAPGTDVTLHVYFAHPATDAPLVRIGRCEDVQDFTCETETELARGVAEPVGEELSHFAFVYRLAADTPEGNAVLLAHGVSADQHIDGLKRIVVSKGPRARNQNPVLKDVYVLGGGELLGGVATPPAFVRNTEYQALPVYDAETLEPYVITFDDGTQMFTLEEPFFSWSCTGACTFDTPLSYSFQSVRMTPKAPSDRFSLYVVMRDGRGGVAFLTLQSTLE